MYMYMCVCMCTCTSQFSHVQLFATLPIACRAPPSMGFSRQEYWSGLPLPPPGDLPAPGIKPMSVMSPALKGRFVTTNVSGEEVYIYFFRFFSMIGYHQILSVVPCAM